MITSLQIRGNGTRQVSCNATGCPICTIPGSETHHAQDLTKDLENKSNSKGPKPKSSAPLDHIIHHLVGSFRDAIDSKDVSGIKLVIEQLSLAGTTCTNFLKYNITELTSLNITAEKIHASTIHPPPTPSIQQTHQLPKTPKPQTTGLKTPRMKNP